MQVQALDILGFACFCMIPRVLKDLPFAKRGVPLSQLSIRLHEHSAEPQGPQRNCNRELAAFETQISGKGHLLVDIYPPDASSCTKQAWMLTMNRLIGITTS